MLRPITHDELDHLCPRPKGGARREIWDQYADAIIKGADLFEAANVRSMNVLSHVLSQWGAESGGFTLLWESGAYSADRIVQIFGKGRHSAAVSRAEAEQIAAIPTANDARAKVLFERVYGLGNAKMAKVLGNTEPGDGYKYRGFGLEQITGRHDHEEWIDGDYSAHGAIYAALEEWHAKGCSEAAERDDCVAVTKLINGGTNGLSARKLLLAQAKEIFVDDHDAAVAEDVTASAFVGIPPPKPWRDSKTVFAHLLAIPTAMMLVVSQVKQAVSEITQTASDAEALGLAHLATSTSAMTQIALVGAVALLGILAFTFKERLIKLWEGH